MRFIQFRRGMDTKLTDTYEAYGVIDCRGQRREHAVHGGEAEGHGVHDERVDPELGGVDVELRQEVDGDAEEHGHDEDQGEVQQHPRDDDGGGPVEGEDALALDGRAPGDGGQQLGELEPADEGDGEEDDAAAREGRGRALAGPVEERRDDEAVGDDDDELGVEGAPVAPEEPGLALGAGGDLLRERDGVDGVADDRLALGCVGGEEGGYISIRIRKRSMVSWPGWEGGRGG